MTPLGRSLVFCLKYWDQMRPFVWAEESKEEVLKALPDQGQNLIKIEKVAARAREQAEEFLGKCATEVQELFSQFCELEIATSPTKIQQEWYVGMQLPRPPKEHRWSAAIALTFRGDNKPVVVPYFWVEGGKEPEEKLARILRRRASTERSEAFGWNMAGVVGISLIPIRVDECNDFEIPSEPLIKETVAAFSKITKEDVERISAIGKP